MTEKEVFCQLILKAIQADDLVVEFCSSYHPKYIPKSQSTRGDKKAIIQMPSTANRELVVHGDSAIQIAKVLANVHSTNALFLFSHEFGHHLTNNPTYDEALARCLAIPVKQRSLENILIVIKEETEAWSLGYSKLEEIGFEIPEEAKKLAHKAILGYCKGALVFESKTCLPKIETQNLILRFPELADIQKILSYFKENETHLSPFDPKKPADFYTETFWSEKIPKHHEAYNEDQALRLYIFSKDESHILGTLELSQISRGPFQACYLGYGIAKNYEGKGLMFEALQAAVNFAFKDLNIHRIMANHLPENERSAKILRRLGFVREGVAKEYLRIGGCWRDHVLNSLTNSQWAEK